jgi:hypothetical protein
MRDFIPIISTRVGHFTDPGRRDFALIWEAGSRGVQYDRGIGPAISVNDNDQIIECHQSQNSASLFYRRGTLVEPSISFASNDSSRYDNDAKSPDIALTDQGVAIEVNNRNKAPFSRTGILNAGDNTRVDWSNSVGIGTTGRQETRPSVATNGTLAVAVWNLDDKLYYSIAVVR